MLHNQTTTNLWEKEMCFCFFSNCDAVSQRKKNIHKTLVVVLCVLIPTQGGVRSKQSGNKGHEISV